MTVISTVFSKDRIVVASDGYITDDAGRVLDDNVVKFVKFDCVNCVASFWGYAKFQRWTMKNWLETQNQYLTKHPGRCRNLQELSEYLKTELDKLRTTGILAANKKRGIGLHVAGFESIDDNTKSPELFLITNYSMDRDSYYYVQQDTLDCTRRTIVDFIPQELEGSSLNEKKRHIFDTILNQGSVIIFNNGDPVMFNAFATPIKRARKNNKLKVFDDDELLKHFASWPIQKVTEFQREFYAPGQIVVGGTITTKILTADGQWY